MIESRCGIVCSVCEYKKTMCNGCTQLQKPFWAQTGCPVKMCCEEKKLENCGFCKEFPCDLLNSFAFDKEQGDEGKRIEQCKKWVNERTAKV